MSYYTNSKNPYTNLIDRPYVLWSASQGGASSSDYRLGSTDVTIPATPNYPPSESGASTSYFIFTKWDFYKTSTNSTQFYLYNETQSKVINVVDQDATLSNYTGKFMGQGSEKRNVIECHVGTTSNQASDVISYKAVVSGSAFDAYEINNFAVDTLTVDGAVVFSTKVTANKEVYFFDTLSMFSTESTGSYIDPNSLIDITNVDCYNTYTASISFSTAGKNILRNYYKFYSTDYSNIKVTVANNFGIYSTISGSLAFPSTVILWNIENLTSTIFSIYASGGIRLSIKTLTSDITSDNLNTAFGNSTSLGAGFIGYFTTGSKPYLAISNGSTQWYTIIGSSTALST